MKLNAEQQTAKLPQNVNFLYKKAEVHELLGNNRDALNVYKKIASMNNPALGSITELSEKNKSSKLKN